MVALFVPDLFIFRENPYATEHVVRGIYSTFASYRGSPAHCDGIEFKLLLTQYETSECPGIVRLPPEAVTALNQLLAKWNTSSISQWMNLMRGEGEIAALYQDILFWLLAEHDVDAFLYWGTNHTVRKFAESIGICSFAMELGPTRPPFAETRYFDPFGVNGDAFCQYIDLSKFAPLNLEALPYKLQLSFPSGESFDAIYRPIRSSTARLIYDCRRPKALIALQLDDDSNCLVHSAYSGMEQMIRSVVPKLVEKGFVVFVKPHPAAHPSKNQRRDRWLNVEAHQACRAFLDNYIRSGQALWLDDVDANDYLSLLDKMDAVISVNSSVGFEAILLGKTVVVLGRSPYNIGESLPTLEDVLNDRVDRGAYRDTAARIANVMLNYYLYPSNLLSNPLLLSSAVRRAMAINEQYKQDGWSGVSDFVRNNPVRLVK